MKYSYSVRLAAVRHYLSTRDSMKETARLFGVGETPLSRWIRAFRQQGEPGLEHRPARAYTAEFRLRVVRYVIRHGYSSADASAHFAIPNETLIRGWIKRYREGGARALHTVRPGAAMSGKKFIPGTKPISKMTPAELQRELEYLRAENAYLKKLKALREE
ncbi:helix-turn-helix domain-containing protein, partial [Atlantibacter hermannii]